MYGELLETRRQYVVNVTPVWCGPTLLLCASSLDTDTAVTKVVVDGWLLLHIHDGTGPKVKPVLFARQYWCGAGVVQ